MLCNGWVAQYASTDIRESVIERGRIRERKLKAMDRWYFYHVLELPSLTLQVAFLLFICALSRYLWEVDTASAFIVIGFTSFGLISYLFVIVVRKRLS
jgi:hypothetical protein